MKVSIDLYEGGILTDYVFKEISSGKSVFISVDKCDPLDRELLAHYRRLVHNGAYELVASGNLNPYDFDL